MAVQTPLYVIQNASHPAKTFRQANGYYVNTEGVGTTGDLAVTANSTPAMNVDVAAGEVWIKGDSATDQGFYFGYNDATVNLAIASADGSNPRIDIVVAQVNDAAYSGSANNWELKVITGTAAGSPSVPTLPSSAYKLAQIAVGAGVTTIVSGNITDSRTTVEVATYGVHHFEQTTAPGTTTNKLYNVSGALYWNGADISTAGDITGVTAGTNLNGGGASGAVTLNLDTTLTGGLTFSGALQMNNTVTVGENGTGKDVQLFGDTTGSHMLWDESADELHLVSTSKAAYLISKNGTTNTYFGSTGSNTALIGTSTAHRIQFVTNDSEKMTVLSSGNVGIGATNPSEKFYVYQADGWDSTSAIARFENLETTAAQGNTVLIKGGASSTSSRMLDVHDMSGNTEFYVRGDGTTYIRTLSKDAGSFDIQHPLKKGDWRLRHSLIEGPRADNIYRGEATISGSSVEVDLDASSGMTDGTWVVLNTNGWAMVASSGNAVEWSLSGNKLTITGPDKAVCSWMVIGERHDPTIKDPQTKGFDDDGKLIVEAEDPDMPGSESYVSG